MKKAEGLTLLEAMERYSEREEWTELHALNGLGPFLMFVGGRPTLEDDQAIRALKIKRELTNNLIDKLVSGELIATAYVVPLRADSGRITIPADKWTLLQIKLDDSTAKGHGLELADIRITEPGQAASTHPGRKPLFTVKPAALEFDLY